MPTVREVLAAVESIAPPHLAYSFDRIGLQIGDPSAEVRKGLVCLDCSVRVAEKAAESGANLVIAHHPLIWEPLKGIRPDTTNGQIILKLIQSGVAFIAAHTNWDCAPGGINDTLAALLGLVNTRHEGKGELRDVFKLAVFVPHADVDKVIDAMSAAGSGVIGNYERCAFLTQGEGTFLPGDKANPAVGAPGQIEKVGETRVEMRVPYQLVSQIVAAMQSAHPYEEPAYDLHVLRQEPNPSGMVTGELADSMTLQDFVDHIDQALGSKALAWGDPDQQVRKVGIIGGAAGNEWPLAQQAGCDAYLTGEIPHHQAITGSDAGMCLIQAGHFETENPGMKEMARRLSSLVPGTQFEFVECSPGLGGHPVSRI